MASWFTPTIVLKHIRIWGFWASMVTHKGLLVYMTLIVLLIECKYQTLRDLQRHQSGISDQSRSPPSCSVGSHLVIGGVPAAGRYLSVRILDNLICILRVLEVMLRRCFNHCTCKTSTAQDLKFIVKLNQLQSFTADAQNTREPLQ